MVIPIVKTDHHYGHGSLHVNDDGSWRIIAPFITGSIGQKRGTGGERGMWQSSEERRTGVLLDQPTDDDTFSHTCARRVLNGNDEFAIFWAVGDAWNKSLVDLYFLDIDGNVYALPSEFDPNADFAMPVLVHAAVPEPSSFVLIGLVTTMPIALIAPGAVYWKRLGRRMGGSPRRISVTR